MSDTKKAEKPASKVEKKMDMVDPNATAPSNDPNPEQVAPTATEPNSKERIAEKAKTSRTGRNNGGDETTRMGYSGLKQDFTADRLGEREAVSPATTDVIWTNSSKDRWGIDQPELGDLLAQRDKIAEKLAEEK